MEPIQMTFLFIFFSNPENFPFTSLLVMGHALCFCGEESLWLVQKELKYPPQMHLELSFLIRYLSSNNLPDFVHSASWHYFKSISCVYDLGYQLYRAAVHNPGYTLEPPKEFLKILMPQPHSRPIKSEPLAGDLDIIILFKAPLRLHLCRPRSVVFRPECAHYLEDLVKQRLFSFLPPQFLPE